MDRQPDESSSLLARTKTLLRQYGLHARKGLGQNFLVDRSAIEASISAAELVSEDVVVEVGPGLGVLTEELSKSVQRVIAIEIDPRISVLLTKRFSHHHGVSIVNADVLQLDIKGLLEREPASLDSGYKVVANLPYYIAAPTIRHFLEAEVKPRRMVVMVQKEVAQNMVAAPGRLSIFGISVQLYGKADIVCYVPAESFYPAPKVDSAIVRIDVYEHPAVEADIEGFFRVVKAGFSAPRKQLRNSLAQGLGIVPAASEEFLSQAGISFQRRAETLTLEEWASLCHVVLPSLAGGS
ncbi:MAG: 16S rRNA (adenine(1518)-N(6)/adenine(1519)-N(6))-dimethyltransferase RsmA [Dehalococcoidia bacterium]|nr:16S rRNA (adenine(1518)-N(6)/adenine(1519)-N(6))-dimethyltransferase RsmA [Dehalococcoidia bacterium]